MIKPTPPWASSRPFADPARKDISFNLDHLKHLVRPPPGCRAWISR